MSGHRGHLRRLDRLLGLAFSEARRLGCVAVGPEDFVLAILHPDAEKSLAAQALRDCGVDRAALDALAEHRRSGREIEGGPQLNPAAQQLMSRAEGMAAGLGDAEVTPEHVLLAFLWEPGWASRLPEGPGSSRERLLTRLGELGVRLPSAALPPADPRRWGPKVDVPLDELWILLRELPHVMPAGAQVSFNHDWTTGWIAATEGVDLSVQAPRALARHRRVNLPPDVQEEPAPGGPRPG